MDSYPSLHFENTCQAQFLLTKGCSCVVRVLVGLQEGRHLFAGAEARGEVYQV